MKKQHILTLFFAFAVVSVSAQQYQRQSDETPLIKLQIAEAMIKNNYVDSVNESKLVEDGIRGMLEKLDPHSTYTTAKETKALTEPLEGSFEGIGVQFNIVQDTLLVIQTITNGPSEKVGILPGDRIVSVNDTAIAGVKMDRNEVVRRLRGPKGTQVRLGIVRRGIPGKLVFIVTRDKIPVKTIDAVYMIRPNVGYIRIGSFGATTYQEFMEGVARLKKQGMQDLVLDLQDNGGGYLMAAVGVANEFLKRNDLVVYTQGRASKRDEFRANGNGRLLDGKVVVLVNEFSASAAEIVTGAIQDQDRGSVVGRRTFGKGLVQRPIPFRDGSMIRLTIAHYYTPSGRCIQKPYQKGDIESYERELDNRYKRGELYSADSIHFADSLKYQTLRQHRTVYGGGGIMPDYFVPLDTLQFTRFHRMLNAKSIIINANLRYVDNNRKTLKNRYKTFDDFNTRFTVPLSQIDAILKEGEAQQIKPKDQVELKRTLPLLRIQLKALVARDLWDMDEYFQIMNETNHVVRKALEVLSH
ncbi:S41 family peptidase [Hoylesella pleuritidis]|jgi:peptidase, S41 family|uniref:Peptidase, S41 family n=1 Tax=Hoylesella pleuritidis F0068 TaxID=1081904 RepID=U2L0K3_9BACT|nr:S41 family peptidase [Hoylesella pleuritidis]ERJ97900.1 peptidase, S41 family [Hoylesella pleuritidis F0068]